MASRVNLLADPNREGTHRYLCVVARTIEALVHRRPGPTSSTTVPRSQVARSARNISSAERWANSRAAAWSGTEAESVGARPSGSAVAIQTMLGRHTPTGVGPTGALRRQPLRTTGRPPQQLPGGRDYSGLGHPNLGFAATHRSQDRLRYQLGGRECHPRSPWSGPPCPQ